MNRQPDRLILEHAALLEKQGRLSQLRDYCQHGHTSVYDHVLSVADLALRFSRCLPFRVDEDALVRGALLHDYFLYDWHIPEPGRPLHGFYHPRAALQNAMADFKLGRLEKNIIRRHMFPLTLTPPTTLEGILVCLADKVCALRETFRR